eukprot:gene8961-9917_t
MADILNLTQARTCFKDVRRTISSIQGEADCLDVLRGLHLSLLADKDQKHAAVLKTKHPEFEFNSEIKHLLLKNFYSDICTALLNLAASVWFNRFAKIDEDNVYNSFFFEGEPIAVLISLTESLKTSSHSSVVKTSVKLLENFLERGRLETLMFDQSKILPVFQGPRGFQYSPATQMFWDEVIRRIISLPDKVSNIFKLNDGSQLWTQPFFRILGQAIGKTLLAIKDSITESKDRSLGFTSQILSMACVHNHGIEVYTVLLPVLQKMVAGSPLGCRICSKLFSSVKDSHLEAVLEPLLKKCIKYNFLFSLFGDIASNENQKLRFLMTHKFLLHRFYEKDQIPLSIIGYLAESRVESKRILIETLHKLLDVWGNSNALKHRSYDQHVYISKCILLSIGFLNQKPTHSESSKVAELRNALISKLLETLPPHLQCPIEKFRILGMIIAQEITRTAPQKGIEPLQFEFERDEHSKYLASLASDPSQAVRHEFLELNSEDKLLSYSEETNENESRMPHEIIPNKSREDSELDSDDDLEPYLMDEDDDDLINGVRPPAYLKDCIAGLLSKDDPCRLEACLSVAEKLIRGQQTVLPETILELVKVLLYLQDNYDTMNFVILRQEAMVAALVKCPKSVANYLTTEFYEENYNLRQRMDMLEVISAAAQELSQPIESNASAFQRHLPLPKVQGARPLKEKPNWQLIVEERVKSKTRIISHGRTNPEPKPVQNRFFEVAGDFFFPLLRKFDRKLNTFDLLGEDNLVLGKFIHTLGNVIKAASGLNITRLMAKALLDFIWNIRFHKEPYVL